MYISTIAKKYIKVRSTQTMIRFLSILCTSVLLISSAEVQKFTLIIEHAILPGKSKEQITVNGTIPGPLINITLGNSVELTVINNIYNEFTALHLHGMTQYATPYSDGVPLINQCLIPNTPGNNSFLYSFTPDKAGTYWYHGHHQMHYSDGMYGTLIVFDPNQQEIYSNLGSPYGQESSEWALMFSDWYDVPAADLINNFLAPASQGVEPLPDAVTVNNYFSGEFKAEVDPNGEPIRVRVVNAGSISMVTISVDGMPLQLVELDGTSIQPMDLQYVRLNIGQRCSFVLDFSRIDPLVANSSAIKLHFDLMPEMYNEYNATAPYYNLYGINSGKPLNINWEGWIKFKGRDYPVEYTNIPVLNLPTPPDTNILEARSLVASKAPKADLSFYVLVYFANNEDGANRAYINGYSYISPSYYSSKKQQPLLFDYLYGNATVSDYSGISQQNKKVILGDPRSPVVFPYGKCVELLINNTDTGEHPFHLHGYRFWIISTAVFPNAETLYKNNYLVRDVISIPAQGWARIRFMTTNPGVWLFHCHIPWHQLAGFAMNFLVAPSKLKNHSSWVTPIPLSQVSACNVPVKRIIKLGGYFNVINPANNSQFNPLQAQSLAAFMMAVKEINANVNLLPNYELRVAVRSGVDDFSGAISGAEYLSLTAPFQYYANPSSMYVSDTNIGVDIVVGAGSNIETTGMDQFFNGRQLIQVHTVANDPQLQVGANYPYKIATIPISSFEGRVLQVLGCQYFQYSQVVVFSVNDVYGSSAVTELSSGEICSWDILAVYSFSVGATNFQANLKEALLINVQVFVILFDDPVMAVMLLEQGYDLGLFREGTQIFGSEATTSPLMWNSFNNVENTAAIMKGFIGVKYDPSYTMRTTEVGATFIEKFRKLPSIGGSNSSCYVDRTGIFSVENKATFSTCHKLNFSSFSPDGSNIYPYAPHAYDAVYAIAYALNEVFEVNRHLSFDSSTVVNEFYDPTVVNFEGVTGDFMITSGDTTYPYNTKGDREVGLTYQILSFNTSISGLALVGKYSDEGITICNTTSHTIDGIPCQEIVYNTVDNLPAGNVAPYSQQTTPQVLKVGGFFKPFDANNNPDSQQAQCLAAFLMAINEINADNKLLPKTQLVAGVVSGSGFLGAINAATALTQKEFGGTGVDIVVGAGNDVETEATDQIFSQSETIQIHTVSQAVELAQGALYPWRLQTTPLASYQGRLLQTIGCKFVKLKRVAVFVIDSFFGSMAYTDFQSSLSECALTVVSESIVEYGTTDFSPALSQAKAAETRLFVLLLDQPAMAGQLLEQGFNAGLFREGTAILGTDLITTPLTWQAIVNKKNIPYIMKGFIGLQYSPGLGMMTSPHGQKFISNFIQQPSTEFRRADGTISCRSNSLDDSGDFFLYSLRQNSKSVCGGLDFSLFNSSGANIYPFAAHVYDAVYAVAYAVHQLFVVENKTSLSPTDFYSTLLKGTNFDGASGRVAFTAGSAFYPYNNRGNREVGHDYLIYQFNEGLYSTTTNGTGAFGVIGMFHSNISHLCSPGYQFLNGDLCYEPTFNTIDGSTPVNENVNLTLTFSTEVCCFVLAGLLFSVASTFVFLTYRFRSYKVIHANQREMIYFVLLGAILCAVRILIIGLSVTDATCIAKMWIGHVAFFVLFGVLLRQLWKEFRVIYARRVRSDSRVFDKYSSVRFSPTRAASIRSASSRYSTINMLKKSSLHMSETASQNSSNMNSESNLGDGGPLTPSTALKRAIKVADNFLLYLVEFVVVYLAVATYFGRPYSSFLTQYFNLKTTHEYICTMQLPIFDSVLYTVEGLLLLTGQMMILFLRPYVDHLVESRANMMAIFFSVMIIFICSIAAFGLDSAGLFTEDIVEIILAVAAFVAVSIVIFLLCGPPFYLILSIKHDGLRIHEILMDNESTEEELSEVIATNKALMYKRDRYGQNAFRVALEFNVSDDVLLELIHYFLPFDPETKEPIPADDHGYAWLSLVQKDRNAELVEKILQKYASICIELANATDNEGRNAVNIASQACQRIIRESTYFCKRYEITTLEAPVHLSRSCVVHLALDHRHSGEKVALKLMKNLDQYTREVAVRKEARLSNEFTINILRTHDVTIHDLYKEEILRRGWSEYLYCIVMPCADRDLNRIITNEHIAGKEWGQVRAIAVEIAQALQHMHSNGVIHGDVKSKNIMRIGHRVKLIDFDASVTIGKDYVGAKYSSAFVPPEMIYFKEQTGNRGRNSPSAASPSPSSVDSRRMSEWKQYSGKYFENSENIGVKSYEVNPETGEIENRDKLPYELVLAHDSFDTWAFGVVLFELCAGIPLFLANSEDNILYEAMLDLYAFTDKYKKKRMSEIPNLEARNLVSQMLMKNPLKRPHMSQVLDHPFLSGKKATRMLGESAQFDVFLSYRKQSDESHASLLYNRLTAAGLSVWWDKKSLIPGVPWQEGFCDGLVKSLIFLPLLSREAINSSSVEKQNFSLLSKSSNCDNVLLEHRLALELCERGVVVSIYPVLIGDLVADNGTEVFTDYFLTGCHPTCTNNVVVESVENMLQDHLNRLCFGTPLLDNMTVPVILDSIVRNQGCLVEGQADRAFDAIVEDIVAIAREKRGKEVDPAGTLSRAHSVRTRRKSSSEFMHRRKSVEYEELKNSLDQAMLRHMSMDMKDEANVIHEHPADMTMEDIV